MARTLERLRAQYAAKPGDMMKGPRQGPPGRGMTGKPKNARQTIGRLMSYIRPYRFRLLLVEFKEGLDFHVGCADGELVVSDADVTGQNLPGTEFVSRVRRGGQGDLGACFPGSRAGGTGSVTLARTVHSEKVPASMAVTPSGTVTPVRPVQSQAAYSSMLVTPSGIVYAPLFA